MKGNEDDKDDDREMEVKVKEIHALLKWQISTLILQVSLHSSPTVFLTI